MSRRIDQAHPGSYISVGRLELFENRKHSIPQNVSLLHTNMDFCTIKLIHIFYRFWVLLPFILDSRKKKKSTLVQKIAHVATRLSNSLRIIDPNAAKSKN